MDLTDALRNTAEKKIGKLDKYFSNDCTANISLSVERGRHTVEVTVFHSGMIFRAQETSNDMYASIDKVTDALERQIRKNKTRLEKKLREGAFNHAVPDAQPVEEEGAYDIVKIKNFVLKPMTVEEAFCR
jgi:putative sigma-54 modulation protein